MNNHTAAPWAFEESFDGETSSGLYIKADGERIASLSGNGYTDYANASLIAAAPEMLAVLQEAEMTLWRKIRRLGGDTTNNETLSRITDVIAKAKGQET